MGIYSEFYNLRMNPFGETPDRRFYFHSHGHGQLHQSLVRISENPRGVGVITGEVGAGKTLLSRIFLLETSYSHETALVLNPVLEPIELIHNLNREFGSLTLRDTLSDNIKTFDEFCQKKLRLREKTIIVIDEAQVLPPHSLEALSKISTFYQKKGLHLNLFLFGHSELKTQVTQMEIEHLDIRGLFAHEVEPYVLHRIAVAGGNGFVKFASAAMNSLYQYSKGNPRLINKLCEVCLQEAELIKARNVSHQTVQKAVTNLSGMGRRLGLFEQLKLAWCN